MSITQDSTATEVRPVWLGTHPEPVFAMLHTSASTSDVSTAVLICPPFGWEEMCSHRALRAWANHSAQAGFPAARIDLPGTGDSVGNGEDPGRVEIWTQAVSDAAGWLRVTAGARRVAVVGVGLGGMIAARAAALGGPIDDLILWAVPARGRNLVRELKAQAAIIAALYPDDAETPPPFAGSDITGFLLSSETEADLLGVDLTQLDLPDASSRRVLLIGRDKLGVDRRLREHYERQGADLTFMDVDDYDRLMSHPQETRIPRMTIGGATQWLQRGAAPRRAVIQESPAIASDTIELNSREQRITETPITLPTSAGWSYGLLTAPVDAERAPICAVLLNAGAQRRIGPSRMWVELARRWAGFGVPTVRIDLEAIGDADGDDGQLARTANLYSQEMTNHAMRLLDQLPELGLPDRFVLVGLCSGAYWGLHCALADPRVKASMMVNLYSFFWSQELVAERDRRRTVAVLRGDVLKRLASGRISSEHLRRSWRGIRAGVRKSIEAGLQSEVGVALDKLRDHDTQVTLLLSEGEPLYDQFEREGRIAHLHKWPNVTIDRIPSKDHDIRAMWVQQYVHERLDLALKRTLAREPALATAASAAHH